MIGRISNFNFASENQTEKGEYILKKDEKSNKFAYGFQGNLFDQEPEPEPQVLSSTEIKDINSTPHNYKLITTKEERAELISILNQQKEFCFDTETTGIDANLADIVGISFSFKKHEAFYIPLSQDRDEAQSVLNELKPVLENENIRKVGQNIKYDILMLKWYNINVRGELFDTMLAHYLIQPDAKHNLNYLSEIYLNYIPIPIENLIGQNPKTQKSLRLVDVEKVKEYAGEDADVTWQLKSILEKQLAEHGLTDLSKKVEMPLVHVLADMEKEGVKINIKALKKYSEVLNADMQKLELEIYELAGETFNINSPKQMGVILFDKLKIDAKAKMTKTQQYQTGEEVLVKLKDKHPIVNAILDYRSLSKLISTYIDALPELINPKSRKIHTSFNQAVAVTGRLSSNNPNLQNIPIRDERGREIRRSFVASGDDYTFLSADYSQIELRIMAHLCGDENMIEAFNQNEDFHTATAAKIHKIDVSEVTKDMRSQAKTANFGIIYGISAFGLSERLGISRTDAKTLITGYFETYPGVQTYIDKCIADAKEKTYVETIFKRRRYLKDINSNNSLVRSYAERNAVNAPIQGSAADIIKLAMIKIFKRFEEEKLKSKLVLQVHDELNFDVYKPELEKVKEIVKFEMQNVLRLKVPLLVEMNFGENWLEAH